MLNQAAMVKLLAILYRPVLFFPCPDMGADVNWILTSTANIELTVNPLGCLARQSIANKYQSCLLWPRT
jgi:hypothetical protein